MDITQNGNRNVVNSKNISSVIGSVLSNNQLNHQQDKITLCNMFMPNTSLSMYTNNAITNVRNNNMVETKVLLIGIGYPERLRKQWDDITSPMSYIHKMNDPCVMITVPNIRMFSAEETSSNKLTPINENQAKDFLRARIVEEINHPCSVYSINNCYDKLRDENSINSTNINMNAGCHQFLNHLIEKGYVFDEICFDYFRMSNAYTASTFQSNFFRNLRMFKEKKLLNYPANTRSGRPEIYLPFTPHFFSHIHGYNFAAEYTIRYITTDDLKYGDVNSLYTASESSTFAKYCEFYNIEVGDQERLVVYKKSHFTQFHHDFITNSEVKTILEEIPFDIESIRFIMLSVDNTYSLRDNNQ